MNAPVDPPAPAPEPVRVDKWPRAARIYKTRALAQEACRGGHVTVNGHGAQPAKVVRVGDRLEIRRDERRLILEVAGVAERRGPAPAARQLYVDHLPPPPPRPEGPFVIRDRGAGRPTKRDRRAIGRMRGW